MKTIQGKFKIIYFCLLGITVCMCAVLYFKDSSRRVSVDSQQIDFTANWVDSQNEELTELKFNGEGSIYNHLPIAMENANSICFRSKNTAFSVYVGTNRIYKYIPDRNILFGASAGTEWHYISLPDNCGGMQIRIDYNTDGNTAGAYFEGMKIMPSGEFVVAMMREKSPSMIVSIIMLVISILIMSFDKELHNLSKNHSLIYLGMFGMIASVWTLTESLGMQLFTDRVAWIHLIDYLMLILLSFPIITFAEEMFQVANRKVYYVLMLLSLLDFIFRVVLNACGIATYHYTLITTQLVIICTIVVLSVDIIIGLYKKQTVDTHDMRIVYIGLVSLGICALLDILSNIADYSTDNSFFTRIGMIVFILCMCRYVVSNATASFRISQEAELMKKLAYTDILTGLNNKTAFSLYLEELDDVDKRKRQIVVLQFDVNNLKRINDTYGHLAGDNYIVSVGRLLEKAYGVAGKCFRTGGDEFIVMLHSDAALELMKRCDAVMDELVEEFNEKNTLNLPWKLAVARGYAMLDDSDLTGIYDVIKKADEDMYANKKQMKLQEGTFEQR